MKQFAIPLEKTEELFTREFSDLVTSNGPLEREWSYGYGVRIGKNGNSLPKALPYFIMTSFSNQASFVYELDGDNLKFGVLDEEAEARQSYLPYVEVERAQKELSPNPKLPEELKSKIQEIAKEIVNTIRRINTGQEAGGAIPTILKTDRQYAKRDIIAPLAFYKEVREENPIEKMKRIEREIDGMIEEMVQVVVESRKKTAPGTPSKKSAGETKDPAAAPTMNDEEYLALLDRRAKEKNAALDSFWRKIRFSRENELEERIAKSMVRGRSQILMGDSGIGKTYTPSIIAKKNGIPVRKIELEANTEGAELIGKPFLRPNLFTGVQEMYFDEGFLVKSFREAEALSRENKGMVLILDELFRMNDMTPLISNLSVNDRGEYALTYDKTVYFAKVDTSRGPLWFELTDEIDAQRQRYVLDGGKVLIEGDPGIMGYGGDREMAKERAFRGDLLSMHKQDFQELFKKNKKAVLETMDSKAKIYVPERAVALIATSNIGEDYEVNMARDNALLSRMGPIPVKAPSVSFMVRQSLKEVLDTKQWSKEDQAGVTQVLTSFFETIDKKIRQDRKAEFGQKVNFRMVRNTIEAISPTDPMKDPDHSVFNVLRDLAVEFVPLDSSLDAESMMESRIIYDVENAVKIIEEEGVGTRKTGKTKRSRQTKEPVEPDNDPGISTGMKI
jgi:hypothetical protein